jgi:hypothetical protein
MDGVRKGGEKPPHIVRGVLVELLAEARILHGVAGQRQPLVDAVICPQHVMAVPDHFEVDRQEYVPTETRGAGDRLAVTQGARRNDAADRLVGAPRRQAIRHQVEEFDERAIKRLIGRHDSAALRSRVGTQTAFPRERVAFPEKKTRDDISG